MDIASLFATTSAAAPSLLDLFSASPVTTNSAPAASTAASTATNGSRATPLLSAVTQALTQVGVPATAAHASGSGTGGQALQSFFQQLLAALHTQGARAGTGAPAGGATDAPPGTRTLAAAHGHQRHGGGGISQAVQSLAQQLAANPAGTSGALGALRQSFGALVTSLGSSSSARPTLGGFLNALAGDLPSGTGALLHARA